MSLNPRVIVTSRILGEGAEEINGEFSVIQGILASASRASRAIAEGDIVQPGGPAGAFQFTPSRGMWTYLHDFNHRTHGIVVASVRTIFFDGVTTLMMEREDFEQAVSEYEVLVENQHRRTAEDLSALGCEMGYIKRLIGAVVST